jgi:predicted transposase YbfD/YdcC
LATDHEIGHGRNITWILRAKQASKHIRETWIGTSWIVEVTASGSREGRPFQATHLFLTSLRTTPKALLQLVRDRWSIEGWHWIRDTQLHEDAHRYRGNGAGVMATLRTAALNLLRLTGFQSIRAGLQTVMHDITAFVTGDGAATTAIDSLLNFESALGLKGFLGRTRKSNKAQK